MTDIDIQDAAPLIDGLDIAALTDGEISALLDSIRTPDAAWAPADAAPVWWLHAELAYGYLVGRHTDGAWTLAGPDGRAVRALQTSWRQIRVFQPGREVILYRDGDRIAGTRRTLTDTVVAAACPNTRILRIESAAAPLRAPAVFPVVRDPATGLTSVIPEPRLGRTPITFAVREHFSRDPDTGAIRVAAVCWDRYHGGESDAVIDAHRERTDASAP